MWKLWGLERTAVMGTATCAQLGWSSCLNHWCGGGLREEVLRVTVKNTSLE